MAKIDQHYQDELFRLQTIAAEYAKANPSQAGNLVGSGTDPDVERILEGVAFLTAGLKAELEQDQDQLLHNLLQVAAPELLRPLPSTAMLKFSPRSGLKSEMTLSAGTPVSGLNSNGKRCELRTLLPLKLWPIELSNLSFGKSRDHEVGVYKFSLTLNCLQGSLDQLSEKKLPLYLNGNHGVVSKLLNGLLHHCEQFTASWGNKQINTDLPGLNTELLQWPVTEDDAPELPGQRLLQRYFLSPELAQGVNLDFSFIPADSTEKALTLTWYMDSQTDWPKLDLQSVFCLFAVPAINLFIRETPPQVRDYRQPFMPLMPRERTDESLAVYRIKSVRGQLRSQPDAHYYQPFWQQASADDLIYQEQLQSHPVTGELQLSVALNGDLLQGQEVIRAKLFCTNGTEANSLLPGQLTEHTTGSSEMVDFTNLTSTTPYRRVLPTRDMQWQAIQQLCSNLLGGLNLQSLHNGLRQLAVNGSPDSARLQINLKKIEAIKALDVAMSERLISSVLLRGFSLHLSIAGDHFPSKSEMKLFTTMLQQFFLSIVPMNHFCELIITDKQTGEQVQWPPMLGRQSLL